VVSRDVYDHVDIVSVPRTACSGFLQTYELKESTWWDTRFQCRERLVQDFYPLGGFRPGRHPHVSVPRTACSGFLPAKGWHVDDVEMDVSVPRTACSGFLPGTSRATPDPRPTAGGCFSAANGLFRISTRRLPGGRLHGGAQFQCRERLVQDFYVSLSLNPI